MIPNKICNYILLKRTTCDFTSESQYHEHLEFNNKNDVN